MSTTKNTSTRTSSLIEKLTAWILGIIIVTMFSQVVFRYLLNQSLYWSEEIVRYLFIWLVFLGGALVIKDDGHIGIDFLLLKLPRKFSTGLKMAGNIVIILTSIFFTVTGFILVYKLKGSYSAALGLPVNWFLYAALPLASVISIWYGYRNLIHFKNKLTDISREVDTL